MCQSPLLQEDDIRSSLRYVVVNPTQLCLLSLSKTWHQVFNWCKCGLFGLLDKFLRKQLTWSSSSVEHLPTPWITLWTFSDSRLLSKWKMATNTWVILFFWNHLEFDQNQQSTVCTVNIVINKGNNDAAVMLSLGSNVFKLFSWQQMSAGLFVHRQTSVQSLRDCNDPNQTFKFVWCHCCFCCCEQTMEEIKMEDQTDIQCMSSQQCFVFNEQLQAPAALLAGCHLPFFVQFSIVSA